MNDYIDNQYMYRNFYYMNQNMNKENNLYDPYQGFIRGNMFPSSYDPYKLDKPIDIKPLNEQAKQLTRIDSLQFAMKDLNLYLDVYPDDKNMINLYNNYRTELNETINNYENKFGPLLLNSNSLNTYPWIWNNRPWPWESGE